MKLVFDRYPRIMRSRPSIPLLCWRGGSFRRQPRANEHVRGLSGTRAVQRERQPPRRCSLRYSRFDDPLHAPIALEAAQKYRDIAPAVSHARHMPSHIFIQHGMWEEVSMWNESAWQAAHDLWQPGDRVGDQNHSGDWGSTVIFSSAMLTVLNSGSSARNRPSKKIQVTVVPTRL